MNTMESLLNQLKLLEQLAEAKEDEAKKVKDREKEICLHMEAIERASIREEDYKWISAELRNIINIYSCIDN